MNVLITGSSSGIGRGCAEYFLNEGHHVYGFDKDAATIQHPEYIHFCLDIRDKSSYPELPSVDILINNAGVQDKESERNHFYYRTLCHPSDNPFRHHDRFCQRTYRF